MVINRDNFYDPTKKYIDSTVNTSPEVIKDIFNLDLIQLVFCYYSYPEERELYAKQLLDFDVKQSLEEIVENFKDYSFSMFNLIFKEMKKSVPGFYYNPYKSM